MMVPFTAKPQRRNRAPLAIAIIAAVVVASALDVVATQLAFLAGAVALVVTGCVGIERAYREIDVRIFVMIAGVWPWRSDLRRSPSSCVQPWGPSLPF